MYPEGDTGEDDEEWTNTYSDREGPRIRLGYKLDHGSIETFNEPSYAKGSFTPFRYFDEETSTDGDLPISAQKNWYDGHENEDNTHSEFTSGSSHNSDGTTRERWRIVEAKPESTLNCKSIMLKIWSSSIDGLPNHWGRGEYSPALWIDSLTIIYREKGVK